MNKIIPLLLFFTSVSCEKEDLIFEINNLNRDMITVLGHGGMGIASTYPMNSFESIMNCINVGSDGTELDVQMTRDGVLVAFHDYDLSAKTNLKGVINSLTWDDIKNGYYNETPYMRYSIVSLEQILNNIDNVSNYRFTFDCKLYRENTNNDTYYDEFANAIIETAEKFEMERKICIESSDKAFLKALQQKKDRYKLFIYPSNFEEGLKIAQSEGFYGVTISTNLVSAEDVQTAHAAGIRVAVWDVRSGQENLEAVQKNPDFIQSDNVKDLVSLLSATEEVAEAKRTAWLDSPLSRKKQPAVDSSSKYQPEN